MTFIVVAARDVNPTIVTLLCAQMATEVISTEASEVTDSLK